MHVCGMRRSLFIPLSDRSSWDQLTVRTVQLLRQLLAECPQDRVTLVGESVRTFASAPTARHRSAASARCVQRVFFTDVFCRR